MSELSSEISSTEDRWLARLPRRWHLGVIVGGTGTGKTRALHELRDAGFISNILSASASAADWPAELAVVSVIANSELVAKAARKVTLPSAPPSTPPSPPPVVCLFAINTLFYLLVDRRLLQDRADSRGEGRPRHRSPLCERPKLARPVAPTVPGTLEWAAGTSSPLRTRPSHCGPSPFPAPSFKPNPGHRRVRMSHAWCPRTWR